MTCSMAFAEFKADAAKHILFIGGSYQLWIPRLKFPDHLKDESVVLVGESGKR